MTLVEIKSAIEALSAQERCELNAWFQDWQPDDCDRRTEADARAGKLDGLKREGKEALQRGECRLFP